MPLHFLRAQASGRVLHQQPAVVKRVRLSPVRLAWEVTPRERRQVISLLGNEESQLSANK